MTFSFQLEKKISLKYFPCMYFQKIWYFGQSIFDFLCSGYFFPLEMTDFLVQKFVKPKKSFQQKKLFIKKKKKLQLGFSSKIEVPQLGSAWLGIFTARARSSRKISARTHLYYEVKMGIRNLLYNIYWTQLCRYINSFQKKSFSYTKTYLHCKPIPCNDYRDFPVY